MKLPALRLHTRVLVAGALLVLMLVATGYTSAASFARVSRAIDAALRDDREAAALLTELAGAIEDEDDVLLLSLSGEAPAAGEAVAKERARFDAARTRLDALTMDAADRAVLRDLGALAATYRRLGDSLLAAGGSDRGWQLYRQELAPIVRVATTDASRLREHRFRATQRIARVARDEARRAMVVVSVAFGASVLLLVVSIWHVARRVLAPLRALTLAVEAMRSGDFDRRVELRTEDELAELARGFNRMAAAVGDFRRSKLGEVLGMNATLGATLEALPEAVLVVDSDGSVARMNARARALLSRGTEMPRSFGELPLPGPCHARLTATLSGEDPGNAPRADLGRAIPLFVEGRPRLFSFRVLPVRGAEGAPIDAVVVLDDVTDFARLDDMRTEFIAAASHELRTPLTTLQMTLALLAEASPGLSPAQRETIATAELGCAQLASTVDEFLDLATLDAGVIGLHCARVELSAWLREVTYLLRPRFEERGVALAVNLPAATPAVFGDRARLTTALSNVLVNALKYSPPGGIVTLLAEQSRATARITVDDGGPGVPEGLRERIFEKYFRVEHELPSAGVRVQRGAGIGLYLCRQIVERHHGHARCEASPSGGARIYLELPLVLESIEAMGISSSPTGRGTRNSCANRPL